jgi:hypothetical protein
MSRDGDDRQMSLWHIARVAIAETGQLQVCDYVNSQFAAIEAIAKLTD